MYYNQEKLNEIEKKLKLFLPLKKNNLKVEFYINKNINLHISRSGTYGAYILYVYNLYDYIEDNKIVDIISFYDKNLADLFLNRMNLEEIVKMVYVLEKYFKLNSFE